MKTGIREIILDEIKKEVFGPREKEETFPNTDRPSTRYLSGVLYPVQISISNDNIENISAQSGSMDDDDDDDEKTSINVGTKPSSMGLTCNIPSEQKFVLATINYGKYVEVDEEEQNVNEKIKNKKTAKRPNWKRIEPELNPIKINVKESNNKYELEPNVFLRWYMRENKNEKYVTLNVFLTNELKVNQDDFILDSKCIFQPRIKLSSLDNSKIFMNISRNTYKKIKELELSKKERAFLFRNSKHFAQGHNCSVEWDWQETENMVESIQTTFVPNYIISEIKPRKVTNEIKKSLDMKRLANVKNYNDYASILNPIIIEYENWIKQLETRENNWKNDDNAYEKIFMADNINVPKNRIEDCKYALERIKEGINKISNEPLIGQAFRFTNEVMYESIAHSNWAKKNMEKISEGEKITEDGPDVQFEAKWRLFQLAFLLLTLESIVNPESTNRNVADLLWFPTGGGKTEAYFGVIVFTLAYRRLRGIDSNHVEKELDRYGISVIMRYTYRLLTLQQFQRATTLFCACEYVRMKNESNKKSFGNQPFLVGLWVGYDTTPNSFTEAKKKIQLKRNNPEMTIETSNPIQLLNCPWCGREFNAHNYEFENKNYGDKLRPQRIQIRCDKKCFFGKPDDPDHVIPAILIDEDIRNLRPSLLISTVDKFAQISWNWEYSTLFGNVAQYCAVHGYSPGNAPSGRKELCKHSSTRKNINGKEESYLINMSRKLAPPELIIQDELHLISGPLGTLTGLYETAIDILCTNETTKARPKIIASTATTIDADKQIKDLFNSKSTKIFPPQGFEFGDSYFAEILNISDENPGKLHVGICSTSVGGFNVDSRITACILRKIRHIRENKNCYQFKGKILKFTDEEIDPYYTLVSYYNTIRNLGGAMRLYEDTIPSYMGTIIETTEKKFQKKNNAEPEKIERLHKEELTGRINATKIPSILQNIETKIGDVNVLDALLCTNMLSVGVDVDRLNIMLVNGQPKSASEYIQATGRIGRKNPGIVITNYTYVRARDLSYFENFIQFHSIYHKLVEPSILTPFSTRARDRGFSGIILALARLTNQHLSVDPKQFKINNPDIKKIIENIQKQILDRIAEVDGPEYIEAEKDFKNFIKKWENAIKEFPNWSSDDIKKLEYRRNPFYSKSKSEIAYLLDSSRDPYNEHAFLIPESLREAESEIMLNYIYKKTWDEGSWQK